MLKAGRPVSDTPHHVPRQKGQGRKRGWGQGPILDSCFPRGQPPTILTISSTFVPLYSPGTATPFLLPCLTFNTHLLQEACPDHPSPGASLLYAWG